MAPGQPHPWPLTRPGWFLQVSCREACPTRLNCARALNALRGPHSALGSPAPGGVGGRFGGCRPLPFQPGEVRGSTLPPFGTRKAGFLGAITQNCASIPSPALLAPQPAAAAPTGLLSSRALHVSVCLVLPSSPHPHAMNATPPSRCLLSGGGSTGSFRGGLKTGSRGICGPGDHTPACVNSSGGRLQFSFLLQGLLAPGLESPPWPHFLPLSPHWVALALKCPGGSRNQWPMFSGGRHFITLGGIFQGGREQPGAGSGPPRPQGSSCWKSGAPVLDGDVRAGGGGSIG